MSLLYNYLLFDAARADENLEIALELNTSNKSLYLVKPYDELLTVAPYFFTFKENTPFADWYLKEGWGESWGILLFSNDTFEHIIHHIILTLI